jgi:hypothetical protein
MYISFTCSKVIAALHHQTALVYSVLLHPSTLCPFCPVHPHCALQLLSATPCAKVPVNLAEGCSATRCELRTASGHATTAILGGQPDVLKEQQLVQHALRMTLVSDSQSLQFRLPPPGVPIPAPRTSVAIAGSTPVVDTLVLTSVWAVQVLRGLCQVS